MKRYKSTAAKKPKKSKVLIFLNIVIGLLTAAVVFGLIGFYMSSRDNYYDRKFGDTIASRYIENREYAQLLEMYYGDWGVLGLVNSDYEECAAVAKYAEAAFRESAYRMDGDAGRADMQKAIMDAAASEVGIYEPEIGRISELLDPFNLKP